MTTETKITTIHNVKESTGSTAPLYTSQPSAGFPTPADDLVEKALDINDLVVQNPASTFFVRVAGDSMEGAGIFSGDVLVIDRAIEAKDGSIVAAAINGEMVVKRLKKEESRHLLVSENENYAPIEVSEQDDVYVWGVVVGSVRQFLK